MNQQTTRSLPAIFRICLQFAFVQSVILAGASVTVAQQPAPVEVEGYVTAVLPPSSFSLNGVTIDTGPETEYGLIGNPREETGGPLPKQLQVGAYVRVDEVEGGHKKPPMATAVLFRDPDRVKLSGLGVILNVVSAGAEPVYEADGYRIAITNTTEKIFRGDLKSLADVEAGDWIAYEGKRDKNGVVLASKLWLLHAKLKKGKAQRGRNEKGMDFKPPEMEDGKKQDGEVYPGVTNAKRVVPADAALQERIGRIGERVVPAYQKALPDGDPAKLNFRFYAVISPKDHKAVCSNEGLILIPKHIVERLKNDDQVAAVLAEGVATLLQRQQFVQLTGSDLTAGALAYIMGVAAPPVSLVAGVALLEQGHKQDVLFEEQRARNALALMADAGYDPWQAPQAWRLIDAKKLPKNLDTLRYPNAAAYQLGVLSAQYANRAERQATNADSEPSSH
jgi:hypothetical protein